MPPPQAVVVFDATQPKLITVGVKARGILPPVRAWALLSIAACCCLPGLTAAFASAGTNTSADSSLQFLSADADFGGERIRELDPLREGYTTLWWSPSPRAVAYRLTDSAGQTLYLGHLPHAFVSGLPDGEHRFEVVGLDAAGEVVATTTQPLVVQVQHWDRRLAWSLFAIGAVVVTILVVVLVVGSLANRDAAASGRQPSAPPHHRSSEHGDADIAAKAGES